MRQLTLRSIPDDIDRMLRETSRKNKKSLNRTVIELIRKALGVSELPKKKRNATPLAGTWSTSEADEFAKNTSVFEMIDREVWKK